MSVFLNSCILLSDYDEQAFVLQTQSLYKQNDVLKVNGKSIPLAGDWLFRRDRLAVLDEQLQRRLPSLLFLQEVIKKKGNWAEYDIEILKAGALAGYQFSVARIRSDEALLEQEFLAFASDPEFQGDSKTEIFSGLGEWPVAWSIRSLNGENILLVNSGHINPDKNEVRNPYVVLQREIEKVMVLFGVCSNRVVLGGFFPEKFGEDTLSNFVTEMDLTDVGAESCKGGKACQTISSENMFISQIENQTWITSRIDRILLSNSAKYKDLGVFGNSKRKSSPYIRSLGVESIYATQRYGWSANVQLRSCSGW